MTNPKCLIFGHSKILISNPPSKFKITYKGKEMSQLLQAIDLWELEI